MKNSKYIFSYWFMCDGHQFIKPKGKNFNEVVNEMIKIAKNNPYGMICPVTVFKDDKEIGRIGKSVHVDKDGNVDINEWINSIKGEHKLTENHIKTIKIEFNQ